MTVHQIEYRPQPQALTCDDAAAGIKASLSEPRPNALRILTRAAPRADLQRPMFSRHLV
jgi:hypothetical protein